MKYGLMMIMTILLFTASLFAEEDTIVGVWMNGAQTSHIQIYKANKAYYGRIVWLKKPNTVDGAVRVDVKNPVDSLRKRPLMGLIVLNGLQAGKDNKYVNGKIYDPKNGKTYSCEAEVLDSKTLALRGYIGVSLLGRTDKWTRIR